MKSRISSFVAFFLFLFFHFSCKRNTTYVDRGFYFWKNNQYSLDSADLNRIKTLSIHKLYVKFFEVETDPVFGTRPYAKTELHIWNNYNDYNNKTDSVLCYTMSQLNIIPAIFIKNTVFKHPSKAGLDSLADNILFLINKYFKKNMLKDSDYKEIQIDCDWTATTKEKYFYFLKQLKSSSSKTISCTLRLYPYKYPDLMGIPPVDKVTLMCYNLINPFENENKNSILDTKELSSYLKNTKKYPKHLDVALPVFSVMQVYQNNQLAGMLNPDKEELVSVLQKIKPLWYEVIKDAELENIYLRKGDKVKLEEISKSTITETIDLLQKYVSFDDTATVTLFHLDKDNLKKYKNETLSSFYSDFTH